MPQGVILPLNAILYAGTPEAGIEYEVETATDMYPGRLVQPGTQDYQIKVGTAAGNALITGVLDVKSDVRRQASGTGPTTCNVYLVGDQTIPLRGDIVTLAVALSGQTINVGTHVEAANNGMVQALSAGKDLGYAVTAKPTNGGDGNEWILVKWTGI